MTGGNPRDRDRTGARNQRPSGGSPGSGSGKQGGIRKSSRSDRPTAQGLTGQRHGDRTPQGSQPASRNQTGQRLIGQKTSENRSTGQSPNDNRPSVRSSADNGPTGKIPSGNRPSAQGSADNRPTGQSPKSKNRTVQNSASQRPHKRLTAREIALQTLVKVAESGAYSNLQLGKALEEAQLSRQDGALATELVYGTIQHQRTLDYRLSGLVAGGLNKLSPWVHQLLRMSAYQLLYLDRVPAHAAVNEAVTIAKRRGHAGISGMVNGVLRNMVRRLAEMKAPIAESDPARRIGLNYSFPDWLAERWIEAYGEEAAESLCAASNEAPRASLRVNRLRATRDGALAALAEAGIPAGPSRLSPDGIALQGSAGHLAATPEYAAGIWSLQDESSMLVAGVCDPAPGMAVLDCCAAPGGKAAHLAELMGDRGRIVANDVHVHKRKLIEDQAQRLGLSSIEAVTGDAAELTGRYPQQSFDLVLLDAPCSGFGVIRRKPEIKWTKTAEDIRAIAEVQRRLLDEAARLVKPGGTLVYSTCTIERKENEAQIAAFLARNDSFRADPSWPEALLAPLREAGAAGADFGGSAQLLPQHFGSDGFFIARMKRLP